MNQTKEKEETQSLSEMETKFVFKKLRPLLEKLITEKLQGVEEKSMYETNVVNSLREELKYLREEMKNKDEIILLLKENRDHIIKNVDNNNNSNNNNGNSNNGNNNNGNNNNNGGNNNGYNKSDNNKSDNNKKSGNRGASNKEENNNTGGSNKYTGSGDNNKKQENKKQETRKKQATTAATNKGNNKNGGKNNNTWSNNNNNSEGNVTDENDFARTNRRSNKGGRSISILGDSMIKDLKQYEMRKQLNHGEKLFVRAFNGASVQDMADHVKPTIRRNPDLVILHAGTNNLREEDPKVTADGVMRLAMDMKKHSEVMVSALTIRRDNLNTKGVKVNEILREECLRHNLVFISHENITLNHLNGGGLHLNSKGTSILAGNFTQNIHL